MDGEWGHFVFDATRLFDFFGAQGVWTDALEFTDEIAGHVLSIHIVSPDELPQRIWMAILFVYDQQRLLDAAAGSIGEVFLPGVEFKRNVFDFGIHG